MPLLSYVIEARDHGLQEASSLFLTDPLHMISFVFPVLSSLLAHRVGLSRLQLEEMVRERKAEDGRLAREALSDRLTGLSNRLCLERDLQAAAGRGEAAALLLLDIDKFKFVNDTMGHDAGDELLRLIGRDMGEALGGSGRLYRLGGDEFVALLPGVTEAAALEVLCRRMEEWAGRPFDLAQGRVAAGISIGITFIAAGEADVAAILKRADLALYRAKETSGSSHALYDPEMANRALARIEIERDLLRALADNEFFLEYQPIVSIESRSVQCFEALLRWRHPVKGLIQPASFIPLAEKTGMILPIGKWVVSEACREASGWPGSASVAVNVSGDQFKDRTFVQHVRDVLAQTGLAPQRLTVEVTESVFSVDVSVIQESLNALREIGVRIALDDFGTGFSSINNLKRFPLDHLKIDKSFTDAMLGGGCDGELVNLMSRLGEAFSLSTTIEGIETETQFEFARLLGISQVQGYLISRPVPAEDVPAFLTTLAKGEEAVRAA